MPTDQPPQPAELGAGVLLRHPPFLFFFAARGLWAFANQIAFLAVGWHIYNITGSALDLGLVGLVQFAPAAVLMFISGHVADRFNRLRVMRYCQLGAGVVALCLALGTANGWLSVPVIFLAVALLGVAAGFESPSAGATLPSVAPEGLLVKATAIATANWQIAAIGGPALGALLVWVGPTAPYIAMTVFYLLAAVLTGFVKVVRADTTQRERPTLSSLFAGIVYVWRSPVLIGTIALDLFVVLLGGATALLPIYAKDILHAGPEVLAILRAAPAVGGILMSVVLARASMTEKVGIRLFQSVIVFGLATIVFAISETLWLSAVALVVLGAADMVSMVIRTSLVQLRTPDDMRGRVSAVNYLFINASNQIGEFESGLTAHWWGAVPAALVGGVGTVAVAFVWMALFPSIRKVQRLE